MIRFDPRTKLALILFCVLCAMFAPDLRFQLALTALVGAFALCCGKWRCALRGVCAYALICLFTRWCVHSATGAWQAMLIAFLGLVHKVYACGMLAGVVISTTRVNEFLSAIARLHCPRRLVIPLAVMLRYPDCANGGLKDIDITIPDGQCVLLCRRSGCGKTTFTRIINGLIPHFFAGDRSGRALLNGESIADLPMYRIAERVGSVFQNPRTQFFNVDTDSEIAFGMENEAVAQEQLAPRVAKAADDLHIRHLLGRNIFALSGGEKQMVAFASVYAMQPEVFVLDEPSSNLDAAAIAELRARCAGCIGKRRANTDGWAIRKSPRSG